MLIQGADQHMRLSFRADVDYLRAIAVLSVVGFHYGIAGFNGGFIGVDIFFVISGFLISRLIWAGIETNTFSFIEFYDRRARRLLPALYTTLLITGIIAWFLAPPDEYRMFFESAISTLLFSSNIYFWTHTGYFDLPTIGKVLIHTWSLSVEEQFYFIFPLATWLWSRWFRDPASRLSLTLIIASTAGLCLLDELLIKGNGPAAFYLSPLRSWEFLIGSIALFVQRWSPIALMTRRIFALLGSAMMLMPMVLFQADTRFPGYHALVPCVGAALFIIAFNQPGDRPRLLFERAGLFVGKISYSLYLWHWPIFILGRAALPLEMAASPFSTIGLLLCSLLLAYLTYLTVETAPRAHARWRGVRVSGLIAGAAVILLAVGSFGMSANGFVGRFDQAQQRMLRYDGQKMEAIFHQRGCFIEPNDPVSDLNTADCLKFASDRQNVLLVGDSTAAHYYSALGDFLPPERYNLLQLTSGGCAPFIDIPQDVSKNCNQVNALLRDLLKDRRLSGVVLSANWSYYAQLGIFDAGLGATLSAAENAGIPTLLFGPSLEFPAPLATTLVKYELYHLPVGNMFKPTEAAFAADDRLRGLARSYQNIQFISVLKTVCDEDNCPLKADPETPIVWDSIHLTPEGSRYVVQKMKPALDSFFSKLAQPPISVGSKAPSLR
jgi:peptidoglycan/LPS O-acetylase OafA/YrhL